jgi:hypothetical protein
MAGSADWYITRRIFEEMHNVLPGDDARDTSLCCDRPSKALGTRFEATLEFFVSDGRTISNGCGLVMLMREWQRTNVAHGPQEMS